MQTSWTSLLVFILNPSYSIRGFVGHLVLCILSLAPAPSCRKEAGSWEILVFYGVWVLIKMEPPVSQIDRVRRALSPDFAMSNNSTPATDQMKKSTSVSEEEWKTPRKEGYPDQSPRSSARKWLKSEEALLTFRGKKWLTSTLSDRNF